MSSANLQLVSKRYLAHQREDKRITLLVEREILFRSNDEKGHTDNMILLKFLIDVFHSAQCSIEFLHFVKNMAPEICIRN